MRPIDRVLERLDEIGSRPRRSGSQWSALCPAHDDRNASLSVSEGTDGKVLLHCHAGCTEPDVVQAAGLKQADLFPDEQSTANGRTELVATYDYKDEDGKIVYQTVRKSPKGFAQRRPDGNGGWIWNLYGTPRIPYRLQEVEAAVSQRKPVFVVEGEKDANRLGTEGLVATTSPGGAGKWRPEFARYFKGAQVAVIPDNDEPGRAHAQDVAQSLAPVASVRVVTLPDLPIGGDISDFFDRGGNVQALAALVKQTPPFDGQAGGHSSEPSLSIPSESPATVPPLQNEIPKLALEQDILSKFLAEIRRAGVVGEDRVAATEYLAITSRVLDKPVSLVVKGASSSGKSHVTQMTSKFFPPKAILPFTGMSEKALVLSDRSFEHRTLIVYEAVGLRERAEKQSGDQTAYFLRSLISEGVTQYEMSVKAKDGQWTTRRYEKKGPTNVIVTTTSLELHNENETRMLALPTNDSNEQTARVLLELAEGTGQEVSFEPWHELQDWIFKQDNRVKIPFARNLAENIPPIAVRLRRDFGSVLNLVKAHAVLHQATRERDDQGQIVATWGDYEAVRNLIVDVVSEGISATVSPTMRETVEAVVAVTPDEITATQLGRKLGLDKSAARRRLAAAVIKGYVENREDRRGRPGRYVVGEPLPEELVILPLPPDHHESDKTAGKPSGGTVAGDSEGVYGSDLEAIAHVFPDSDLNSFSSSEAAARRSLVPPKETPETSETSDSPVVKSTFTDVSDISDRPDAPLGASTTDEKADVGGEA